MNSLVTRSDSGGPPVFLAERTGPHASHRQVIPVRSSRARAVFLRLVRVDELDVHLLEEEQKPRQDYVGRGLSGGMLCPQG